MFGALIVAAGSGKRMNSDINKQFIEIDKKPILIWTIEAFYNNKNIDHIVIAIKKDEEEYIKTLLKKYRLENIDISYGGCERQDSIYNSLPYLKNDKFVLIHDGARPFITDEIINRCVENVRKFDCICVGVKAKDTIKIVDQNNNISNTTDRSLTWYAQTPQAFRYDIIKEAYSKAKVEEFVGTDDASLVEYMGYKVKMVEGSYENIKITTPEDLILGEAILKKRH